MNHTQLVTLMVGQLQAFLGADNAWSSQTGAARRVRSDGSLTRPYRFGRKGQSDVTAILPPRGRFCVVECKTGSGVLSADQIDFLALVNRAGGLGLVARDTHWRETVAAIRAAAGL